MMINNKLTLDKQLMIENWPPNSEYIMAIDESGTSEVKSIKKMIQTGNIDNNSRWFVLSGIIISKEEFSSAKGLIMQLKNKYWKNGMCCGKRVVFHSIDIYHKQKSFDRNHLKKYDEFRQDLYNTLKKINFKIIGIAIDKYDHVNRYHTPYDVYKYSLKLLMERYTMYMSRLHSTGSLLFESRDNRSDEELLDCVKDVFRRGTHYMGNNGFTNINNSVNFNPKRTLDNTKSYFVLELADIFSYSFLQSYCRSKNNTLFNMLLAKTLDYNLENHKYKDGHGIKILDANHISQRRVK